jgi:hypothetical protein
MKSVTVNKVEVLEILKKNKEGHRAQFLVAQEGYRKAVIKELDKMLSDARSNKKVSTYINLPAPRDYTEEYEQVISMLEMSVEDNIVLTHSEFCNFILDNWSWTDAFTHSNKLYTDET